MSAENPYETVLADLKAKRAALDSAIAAMESVMAQGGAPISAGIPSQSTGSFLPLLAPRPSRPVRR